MIRTNDDAFQRLSVNNCARELHALCEGKLAERLAAITSENKIPSLCRVARSS
jgi:hypothetical protein